MEPNGGPCSKGRKSDILSIYFRIILNTWFEKKRFLAYSLQSLLGEGKYTILRNSLCLWVLCFWMFPYSPFPKHKEKNAENLKSEKKYKNWFS